MSSPDPDSPGGMFWVNLIGIGLVLTLLTIFVIFYGQRFLEFLVWLLGDPWDDPRLKG